MTTDDFINNGEEANKGYEMYNNSEEEAIKSVEVMREFINEFKEE